MSSTRNKLIQILSEQETYTSGQTLSDQLNISRSAVWKHINQLKKDGYHIEGITNKGYKIISFPNKISENTISWGLETDWIGKKIIHKQSIPSTQKLAHELAINGATHGTIVIADEQTEGRGRINKPFHSKAEQGIWMSLILRPNLLPYLAPQLTLLTATVLADVMDKSTDLEPQIKWPNDILIDGKKISGILTEMQAEQDQILYVIIGIGINVNQEASDFPDSLQSHVTSLKMETGEHWQLVPFIQTLLQTFEKKFNQFMQDGFDLVKTNWENYGFKINEQLEIKTGRETWQGLFLGIAEDGALLIERDSGKIEKVYSGEISWF